MKNPKQFPKLFFCAEPVDMRKQMLSLAAYVDQSLEKDPFDRCLYIFANRRRDLLKALYWDETGFAMWSKKLDKARFPWPRPSSRRLWLITPEELTLLLKGIDFFKKHEHLSYKKLT